MALSFATLLSTTLVFQSVLSLLNSGLFSTVFRLMRTKVSESKRQYIFLKYLFFTKVQPKCSVFIEGEICEKRIRDHFLESKTKFLLF